MSDGIIARATGWFERKLNDTRKRIAGRKPIVYSASLPDGFGASKITIEFSVPPLPVRPLYAFSDHVVDESGRMTQTVLAGTIGGFAISRDLGKSWELIWIKGREDDRFVHLKAIGRGEILAQLLPRGIAEKKDVKLDLLVLNERGDILVEHPAHSLRWHGCRSVDIRDGTLMYAEYPSNQPVKHRRTQESRVFRSRDRGRSWEVVFTQTKDQIRHFHLLQTRPNAPREWWLASGDLPHECHIFRSIDDGDTWTNITAGLPDLITLGSQKFERGIFRLTDLFFLGDQVVWATDDYLANAQPPGARIFVSNITEPLAPREVMLGRRQFRNIVDLGDHLLFISQRSRDKAEVAEDGMPGVYLMPKRPGAPIAHLFDLKSSASEDNPGFTFSKASRAAVDGTFFSFRSSEDVFAAGNKILQWKVRLD